MTWKSIQKNLIDIMKCKDHLVLVNKEDILFDCKHSVNHVFFPQTSVINFTSKKQSYDDTRRSSRDNELLQRAQSDL